MNGVSIINLFQMAPGQTNPVEGYKSQLDKKIGEIEAGGQKRVEERFDQLITAVQSAGTDTDKLNRVRFEATAVKTDLVRLFRGEPLTDQYNFTSAARVDPAELSKKLTAIKILIINIFGKKIAAFRQEIAACKTIPDIKRTIANLKAFIASFKEILKKERTMPAPAAAADPAVQSALAGKGLDAFREAEAAVNNITIPAEERAKRNRELLAAAKENWEKIPLEKREYQISQHLAEIYRSEERFEDALASAREALKSYQTRKEQYSMVLQSMKNEIASLQQRIALDRQEELAQLKNRGEKTLAELAVKAKNSNGNPHKPTLHSLASKIKAFAKLTYEKKEEYQDLLDQADEALKQSAAWEAGKAGEAEEQKKRAEEAKSLIAKFEPWLKKETPKEVKDLLDAQISGLSAAIPNAEKYAAAKALLRGSLNILAKPPASTRPQLDSSLLVIMLRVNESLNPILRGKKVKVDIGFKASKDFKFEGVVLKLIRTDIATSTEKDRDLWNLDNETFAAAGKALASVVTRDLKIDNAIFRVDPKTDGAVPINKAELKVFMRFKGESLPIPRYMRAADRKPILNLLIDAEMIKKVEAPADHYQITEDLPDDLNAFSARLEAARAAAAEKGSSLLPFFTKEQTTDLYNFLKSVALGPELDKLWQALKDGKYIKADDAVDPTTPLSIRAPENFKINFELSQEQKLALIAFLEGSKGASAMRHYNVKPILTYESVAP